MRGLLCQLSKAVLLTVALPLASFTGDGSPGNFVDITKSSRLRFLHRASPTPRKYLLETMGSGVALFDYDNDGRLDIYLVIGPAIAILPSPARSPRRPGPNIGTASIIK